MWPQFTMKLIARCDRGGAVLRAEGHWTKKLISCIDYLLDHDL
jgi:hypothetical protein